MSTLSYERTNPSDKRFEFGKNWKHFLGTVDESRVTAAENALRDMLGDIKDKTFLDAGCGSGLSSLAAHRLGARVFSFDYDLNSVSCTIDLQRKFGAHWPVEQGSILDLAYLHRLGQYDIVYSWGVLHHTGNMNQAFTNIAEAVEPGGILFVAIYNDQGRKSAVWRVLKRAYNHNLIAKALLTATYAPTIVAARWTARALRGRLSLERGMSLWHDAIDWLGGYPFEVASIEEIKCRCFTLGFRLIKTVSVGSKSGCNELVFIRDV